MSYVKAIGPANGSARKGWTSLSHLGGSDATEKKRLSKYQYEWFITQTPDANGYTSGSGYVRTSKPVSSTAGSGTNISESASYKQSSSSTTDAYYYTIFSCGKGESDIIVPIEAVVLVP